MGWWDNTNSTPSDFTDFIVMQNRMRVYKLQPNARQTTDGRGYGIAPAVAPVVSRTSVIVAISFFLSVCVLPLFTSVSYAESVQQRDRNHDNLQLALAAICGNLGTLNNLTSDQQYLLQACDRVEIGQDQGFDLNLQRLTPEEAFIFQDATVGLTDSRINNMLVRLNSLRTVHSLDRQSGSDNAAPADSIATATRYSASAAASQSSSQPLRVFVLTSSAYGQYETPGLQSDFEHTSLMLDVGADLKLKSDLLVGGSIGLHHHEADFITSGSDSYMTAGNLSLFGSWLNESIGYADAVLDFGYHRFNLRRKNNLFDERRQFGIGKTDSFSTALAATVGRDFRLLGFDLGPYVRLAVLQAEIDGYQELATEPDQSGGGLLTVRSHTAKSQRMVLGGQITREFGRGFRFRPQLRLEAVKEFSSKKSAIDASFVADPTSTSFSTVGDKRDTLVLNSALGMEMGRHNGFKMQAFVVSRWMDDHAIQHWLKLGLQMRF